MRVISQSGYIDIPYEGTAITVGWSGDKGKYFIYGNGMFRNTHTELAEYSTEEKAIKAMEMLREVYSKGIYIEYPKIDENKISKDDDLSLWNAQTFTKFYPEGYYRPCKIFQFPADDEIEV
jgi:hypothetical protein